jgi:NAD(P)H-hydrate epimerase
MKQAEAAANASGHSYDAMMEAAGRAVAEAVEAEFGAAGHEVTVLVGPGNNGGDGLVAARYLSDAGTSVSLYLWKRNNLDDDLNWQRLADYGLPVVFAEDDTDGEQLASLLDRSAIVIDALLGTGVSRPIGGSLAGLLTHAREIIDARRTSQPPHILDPIDPSNTSEVGPAIVAVDVPSGLYADSGDLDPLTLAADLTVTFAAPKRGHVLFPGAAYVGQLLIADIGIEVDALDAPQHAPQHAPQLATAPAIAGLLPARPAHGHKGTFGRVMVVAGCRNYTGAPALAGTAAYRVGAGLVTVATPASIQGMVAANLTEATYLPLPEQDGAVAPEAAAMIAQNLSPYRALLVGPGLSQAESSVAFISALLATGQNLPPTVFDADALNILAQQSDWWKRLPPRAILTPHPGEMSRLTGLSIAELEANRLEIVPEMARKWRQTVIFKGAFTVVADPAGGVMVMPFANPALSTAGSGDVLAGCIVGMLGQGAPPFEAAIAGAYLHGLAGELARERFWEAGVMAGDLLPLLPLALREIALQ